MNIYKNKSVSKLEEYRNFVFSLAGVSNHQDFSKALISAHEKGNNLTAGIQDEAMKSKLFHELAKELSWKKMAAEYLNVNPKHLNIIFPHFRLDLPDRFKNDSNKLLLPWHQEAEYYLKFNNCSKESIVISTVLHDISESGGALVVAKNSEEQLLNHQEEYMDPIKKRFFRVECSPPDDYVITETKFGESVVFDFLTKHKSGYNKSDLVRLTFIVRVSDTRLIK
tara:strand:- start:17 stop:688 length:672 start_codon:yes stop_codon:yes gene_type:complete